MTRIITTIGPASEDAQTLRYFAENKVEFARLNFSHNTATWHVAIGLKAREAGLSLMLDLAGPKVLLGDLNEDVEISDNQIVYLELQKADQSYPLWRTIDSKETLVLPTQFDISEFLKAGKDVLIDDGKVHLKALEIQDSQVKCQVIFGGKVKNHKGVNLPQTELNLDFLVERDRSMLGDSLAQLKPEYVAPSFVKTVADLETLNTFMKEILENAGITDYFPKICTKIEMAEAVDEQNLLAIIDKSDMIMIARGDLALETMPAHINVPRLQDLIVSICKEKNKPVIVATQILETMFASPVPTRAEVSDLYRAIAINQADYVMLSAESAAGKFARKCVSLMSEMIDMYAKTS